MAKIFVSYSRVDSAFVDQFVQNVRHAFRGKATVWYDNEIHGGADWWQMILSQIQQADLFIYLISNESLESSYCQAEMEEAMRLHKLILPVLIRRTDFTKAPEALRRVLQKTQYIDFSKGMKDTGATINLFAAVRTLLEDVPAEPPVPRSPHPVEEPPVVDKQPAPAAPSSNRFWPIAGGLLVILAALVAVYFLVLRDTNEESASTQTTSAEINQPTEEVTEAAFEPTESPTERPSITPTRTRTPTATSTPSATLELLTQIAMEFTQTKIAGDAFASATAAQWTYTPSSTPTPTDTFTATPDYTQTYEKARDDFSATLTAEGWTDTPTATPTNTPTATLTPTPTLTEREKALKRAGEGVSSNEEWTPYVEEINGIEMVLVPKGCFMMGSEEGEDDEKPIHEQCFDEPFWIDRTEVTRAMYEECVDAGACTETPANEYSTRGDQPINRVTWFQARDYCEWRGARLPTEREWEYAARGPDNLIFPWGNEFVVENVIYEGNSSNVTAEVGSRPGGASWVGTLDMSGNVWEWVSSLYDVYPYTDARESNISANSWHVLRGGSFNFTSNSLRAANRLRADPNSEYNINGVRCARSS